MAIIRTWADIQALGGEDWLTPAEQALIDACKAGEICVLGDGDLPPEGPPTPDREVRADLLRYLILGGCNTCPVLGWGVRLEGAHVTGKLDLSFATANGVTGLLNCRFAEPVTALQTRFEFLNLSGCQIPHLNAQGAQVTGSISLRGLSTSGEISLVAAAIGGQLACLGAKLSATEGFALNAEGAKVTGSVVLKGTIASGAVSFSGATIRGQLICDDATLTVSEGNALNAQGMEVTGDVFLSSLSTHGEVRLSGAVIGGQLDCEGATLTATTTDALNAEGVQVMGHVFLSGLTASGEVSLAGAIIGGQLNCREARLIATKGDALNLQRAKITQGFFWRGSVAAVGTIRLSGAHVGDLVDDPICWPDGGNLILDGFTYDRIEGAPADAKTRIAWLKKGCYWEDEFLPQPFTHLAKVLREMGHERDARIVLCERERLRRLQERKRRFDSGHSFAVPINLTQLIWDSILRWVVGYGYRPFRSVVVLLALMGIATYLAHRAYDEGSMAPNSGPVLVSEAWASVADNDNPAEAFSGTVPGRDWETFNRYAYAADLVIPIVDLGQTAAWAPSTERGPWGRHLWWGRWVLTAAGWIVTALGAAAITGVIRRD